MPDSLKVAITDDELSIIVFFVCTPLKEAIAIELVGKSVPMNVIVLSVSTTLVTVYISA